MKSYLILFTLILCSCNNSRTQDFFNYPEISTQIKIEKRFGEKIKDEFSNLDSLNNPKIKHWFKAQDSLSETYFKNNFWKKYYLQKFKSFHQDENTIRLISISETGRYFYIKTDSLGIDQIFTKESFELPERFLINTLNLTSKYITYINPSPNGNILAIAYAANDGFTSIIKFYDVLKKKFLPDEIINVNPDYGGLQWVSEKIVTYLYFPIINKNKSGFKQNSFSVLHHLDTNKQEPHAVFGKKNIPEMPSDRFPIINVGHTTDKYAIGYIASSNDFYSAYICLKKDLITGNPTWKPFYTEKDKIYYDQGKIVGNYFIFRQSTKDGNRLAKVCIKNADFKNLEILAKGSQENLIIDFVLTKDFIYFTKSKFASQCSLFKISKNGTLPLQTPIQSGDITFFYSSPNNNIIGLGFDGWTSPYKRYIFKSLSGFQPENIYPDTKEKKYQNLTSTQFLVKSHDGTKVPLTIVHKKDMELNMSNPAFIFPYGAYGESMTPFFSPIFLQWVIEDGILVFPHVRGGGEKGKIWHEQGMKSLKHNSWKDLNACVKYLINKKYTSKNKIVLYTSSAGGITAGMAVNEEPESYKAFIGDMPRLHPYGLEKSSTSTSTSYLEYGSINDSTEVNGLLKMDPYLNIEKKSYPAVLIMASNLDDKIPLSDAGKYIAQLQKSSFSKNPILLDIDYQTGHDEYLEEEDVYLHYAKIFGFAKSNIKN